MAIKLPDPGNGIPEQKTGNDEWTNMKIVRDNFADQSNAASRLVGTGAEQIPLSKNIPSLLGDAYTAAFGGQVSTIIEADSGVSPNDFSAGSKNYVRKNVQDMPTPIASDDSWYVETKYVNASPTRIYFQEAVNLKNARKLTRVAANTSSFGTSWRRPTKDEETYTTTTASGANVVVNTAGDLMRSTSSERYKDILAPLELDDARYADAMALKPIVYRSTADADNPAYHYYSFSAEELGAYDPAFTLWRETETVTDEEGNVTEQPLAERQAEGININALLAMGHAIAIKQGELIKDLQEQVDALKLKLEV